MLRTAALAILLAGCAAMPCEDYGVRETGTPLAPNTIEHPLPRWELIEQCGPNRVGCWVIDGDTAHLYWIDGDQCARRHEQCHAEEGPHHTVEYTQRVIAGVDNPTCPER